MKKIMEIGHRVELILTVGSPWIVTINDINPPMYEVIDEDGITWQIDSKYIIACRLVGPKKERKKKKIEPED